MLEIKMIAQSSRDLLPGAFRSKPAFLATSDGDFAGYCVYDVGDGDTAYILALHALHFPPETAELLVRAVAVCLEDYFEYLQLSGLHCTQHPVLEKLFFGEDCVSIQKLLHSGCAGNSTGAQA